MSLDPSDEALIEQICRKYRPFARLHRIVQLAVRYGLRALHDDMDRECRATPEATEP